MWGSYVSAAIYHCASLYTWFINIKDNQHRGATAYFYKRDRNRDDRDSLTLIEFKTSKASYWVIDKSAEFQTNRLMDTKSAQQLVSLVPEGGGTLYITSS